MREYRNNKRKLKLMLIVLLVIGIGIGYAIFTQQLTIDSTISYGSMKYDVGFIDAEDGYEDYINLAASSSGLTKEAIEELFQYFADLATPTATISKDKKSITVDCELKPSLKNQMCFVKATISNASAFNVAVSENPIITYDDTYIESVELAWLNHSVLKTLNPVAKGQILEINKNADVIFIVRTKALTENTVPTNNLSIPITLSLNFEETEANWNQMVMLESNTSDTAFRSDTYQSKIKNITFEDEINIPENAVESWDIGIVENGKVMSYVVQNENDSTYYDLYIQSDGKLYANWNMSNWFKDFEYVETINGLELLDTSLTTNMESMFHYTGYLSSSLTIDLSSLDTSNVTDMSWMFAFAGKNSTNFTLDVSNFDTNKVTDMGYMFYYTGEDSTNFTLDVSNFDTSKVTNMSHMFDETGYYSTNFTLDVSNFDTSNVTNMSYMFKYTGYKSTNFTLDVSNFDTSNVTDMSSMFEYTGYNSTNFTLDVSNFDTSNVTNMSYMFRDTGYYSTNFTLDVSNFDTSNVTDMSSMFEYTGYSSTKFNTTITIRNPNTTSYNYMFYDVATKTGSQITVNYTSETSELVDKMINTKSSNSNVVKGVQVD